VRPAQRRMNSRGRRFAGADRLGGQVNFAKSAQASAEGAQLGFFSFGQRRPAP